MNNKIFLVLLPKKLLFPKELLFATTYEREMTLKNT